MLLTKNQTGSKKTVDETEYSHYYILILKLKEFF